MFEIRPNPAHNGDNAEWQLVDEERLLAFDRIGGNGPVPGESWVLRWEHRQIPMSVVAANPNGDTTIVDYAFDVFGGSGGSPASRERFPIFHFESAEEEATARRFAIEGLLVYVEKRFVDMARAAGWDPYGSSRRFRTGPNELATVADFGYHRWKFLSILPRA